MPETALPALAIDHRELDRRGEFFECRGEGECFEKQFGIGGAIGFDKKDSAGLMLEFFERGEEFCARTAADTVAIECGDGVGKAAESFGVDTGVLVIVNEDRGLEPNLVQREDERLQECGLPGSKKTDDEDERSFFHRSDVSTVAESLSESYRANASWVWMLSSLHTSSVNRLISGRRRKARQERRTTSSTKAGFSYACIVTARSSSRFSSG